LENTREGVYQGTLQGRHKVRKHNRNRVEVIYDILSAIGDGEIKTHIMYKANLSYDMLRLYLPFLLERGLLEKVTEGKASATPESSRRATTVGPLYKVTSKGWRFIADYGKLQLIARINS
jgi:predicted transcriptional regulator